MIDLICDVLMKNNKIEIPKIKPVHYLIPRINKQQATTCFRNNLKSQQLMSWAPLFTWRISSDAFTTRQKKESHVLDTQ